MPHNEMQSKRHWRFCFWVLLWYVGKLELNDERTVAPAAVKDVVAEVKKETKTSMTVKLHWGVDAEAKTS